MKDSNFVTKTITAVGIAAVIVYLAVIIGGYLVDPLTTAAAYYYQSDDALAVSGCVVREERILPSSQGLLYLTRAEGEKVSRGSTVAEVFRSEEDLERAQRLQELQAELERLEYAQSAAEGSQAVLRLDGSIVESLFTLKSAVAQEDLTAAAREGESLRTLILQRDYTGQGQDVQARIEALIQEIRTLTAAAQQGSTAVTVSEPGIFSAVVDGYEAVLTPDMLPELTPSALAAAAPDAAAGSNVGKLILGNTWYYAAAVAAEDVRELEPGDQVTLRFASGLDRDVPMSVFSIGPEENGRVVLTLSADRYLSLTTLLRRQNAQLIYRSYTGIRVPKEALRVVTDPAADAEGREEERQLTGVYCLLGLTARFKPVEVVYQGEDYYLVRPCPEAMNIASEEQLEIRTLRGGDEIIVTARDLYDGKVIGS